eukprot:Gb_12749 [translate_table: standard]
MASIMACCTKQEEIASVLYIYCVNLGMSESMVPIDFEERWSIVKNNHRYIGNQFDRCFVKINENIVYPVENTDSAFKGQKSLHQKLKEYALVVGSSDIVYPKCPTGRSLKQQWQVVKENHLKLTNALGDVWDSLKYKSG